MDKHGHRNSVCHSPVINLVPRKQMLRWSLEHKIFMRDTGDQHLWKERRGSRIELKKLNCDAGSWTSKPSWQGTLEQILCIWIVPDWIKMAQPLHPCFVQSLDASFCGKGQGSPLQLTQTWINYQLRVSAYRTPCNWTANPSLRKDLGDTSLRQPQARTGNNWNVYQLKNGRFNWRLNSALFIQHACNSPMFPRVLLWSICPRATTDPILAST